MLGQGKGRRLKIGAGLHRTKHIQILKKLRVLEVITQEGDAGEGKKDKENKGEAGQETGTKDRAGVGSKRRARSNRGRGDDFKRLAKTKMRTIIGGSAISGTRLSRNVPGEWDTQNQHKQNRKKKSQR